MKTVLTIAGSDCSGGAGIQADIKTITAHKKYALSAITALTAQNTTGVYGIQEVSPDFLANQLDCIFTDIFPDAVKIGMVASGNLIEVIAEKLLQYKAKNIVVDPVMVATSGSKLIDDNAMDTLIHVLLPLATVITPNLPEAAALCGFDVTDEESMRQAAKSISAQTGGAVLIKGGHLFGDAADLLYEKEEVTFFRTERIENPNTHGTGCTLSSAIACNLAEEMSLSDSIGAAKNYLTGALAAKLDLGKGRGPLNHMYRI